MMRVLKIITLSFLAYLIVQVLFFSEIISGSFRYSSVINFITLIYGLFSYIALIQNFINKFSKKPFTLSKKIIIFLIALSPLFVIGTIILQKQKIEKNKLDRQVQIEKSNQYNDQIRHIVLNTKLGEATFDAFEQGGTLELLVKIPIEFDQKAINSSSINELKAVIMRNYYQIYFGELESLERVRDAEDIPLVNGCKIRNQSLRFQDPRIEYKNEMLISDKNPAFYISIYLSSDCDLKDLTEAIGKSVYLYSYSDFNDDSKKVVKKYIIKEFKNL